MSPARHTQTVTAEVVRWEPTGIVEVDSAVARWRPASMVPQQFRDDDGTVRVADLGLAALLCYDLDVSPRINLPFLYVVHGRVGLMATLQRALAARAGWDLEEMETSASRVTWRIRPAGCNCEPDELSANGARRVFCRHWKPPYTFTWDMAVKAKWAEKDTYKQMPEAMLSARACTWLIDRYAPGVKLGIDSAVMARGGVLDDGDGAGGLASVGESGAIPPAPTPREYRDDGSTIPKHRVQPAATDEERQALIDRLSQLELVAPERMATLRELVASTKMPSLHHGGPEFKLAHAMLLDRLFAEVEQDVGLAPGSLPVAEPATLAGNQEPSPTPADVADDAPEARGYDPDDDGRPFE